MDNLSHLPILRDDQNDICSTLLCLGQDSLARASYAISDSGTDRATSSSRGADVVDLDTKLPRSNDHNAKIKTYIINISAVGCLLLDIGLLHGRPVVSVGSSLASQLFVAKVTLFTGPDNTNMEIPTQFFMYTPIETDMSFYGGRQSSPRPLTRDSPAGPARALRVSSVREVPQPQCHISRFSIVIVLDTLSGRSETSAYRYLLHVALHRGVTSCDVTDHCAMKTDTLALTSGQWPNQPVKFAKHLWMQDAIFCIRAKKTFDRNFLKLKLND
ncbi:hypothetical protein MSG28_011157 [Choristoneura fumiferana]|uniref:Uncharacterized protein n=1 Tax=Choristoneura fumiferana TaxID=7141 RepID=A0ACC0KQE3_CHOFU|nr:hypothetical protein MSG28_011157 [Choristoneura fumiferana]